jgi:Holliday junction DNA helicase RuvA
MIARLTGIVIDKELDRAVIDIAGVGYEVLMSTDGIARLPDLQATVSLHIHTHVREDAFVLFGFLKRQEKQMFLVLTTVSGIGPKVALAIISGMRVDDLCRAITEKNIKQLTTLKGIGKKTAERLCVELKDKISMFAFTPSNLTTAASPIIDNDTVSDVLSALTNLGYQDTVARKILADIEQKRADFANLSVEVLLKECLKAMA